MQRSWMPALLILVAALAVPRAAAADDRSQRWVVRALDAEADGDYAAATAAAKKAVEADAGDGDAQYHLGRFLLVGGDATAALAAFDAAEAAGRAAPIERAAAMQRFGRSQEAIETLKPALAVTEPEGAAWLLQGHLMVDIGDDAAALDAYGQAISDSSTAAAGRVAKARVLQRQGNSEAALAEARQAADEATDERTAQAARNLVAAIEGPKRWNLRVMLGHQVDTNVVLLQTDERVAAASFAPQEISDRIGNRWTLTLGGEYRVPVGDGGQFGFGYSGYQSYHRTHRETLQRYDVGAHSPTIRYIWQRGRMSGTAPVRVSWTLLGPLFGSEGTDTTRTDLRLYSRSIDFAPTVAVALGETARLFGVGSVSAVDFTEPDRSVMLGGTETSLVRSNLAFSLDLGAAWTMLESGELRGSLGLIRSEAWGPRQRLGQRGAAPAAAGPHARPRSGARRAGRRGRPAIL